MNAFKSLCTRVNEIQNWFENRNITIDHINVGGGLGINYDEPDEIPDFEEYFSIFNDLLPVFVIGTPWLIFTESYPPTPAHPSTQMGWFPIDQSPGS